MQLVGGTFITAGENSLAPESSPVLFGGSEILNPLCCLGDQNFGILSYVLGGSEILNLLCCCGGGGVWEERNSESPVFFWDQKFWILSCVVWGVRISEYSPMFLGDQKFWILSCVVWGVRNSESPVFGGSEFLNTLLCSWGIRNSESSPLLFGGSEILNTLRWSWGIRNSESPVFWGDQKFWTSPVFLGDQKFWILSCVVWGVRNSEFTCMNFRLCSLAIK